MTPETVIAITLLFGVAWLCLSVVVGLWLGRRFRQGDFDE